MTTKKPLEETWEVHLLDSRCVVDMAGRVIADIRVPLHETGREVSSLISAAPDMARALEGLLVPFHRRDRDAIKDRELHTRACWDGIYAYLKKEGCADSSCEVARAALRKVGVLP